MNFCLPIAPSIGSTDVAPVRVERAAEVRDVDAREAAEHAVDHPARQRPAPRVVPRSGAGRSRRRRPPRPRRTSFGMSSGCVLEVAVHRDEDLAARTREPGVHRGMLAEVPLEADDADARVGVVQPLEPRERPVARAVVDEEDLERAAVLLERRDRAPVELVDARLLVVDRHDDARRSARAPARQPPREPRTPRVRPSSAGAYTHAPWRSRSRPVSPIVVRHIARRPHVPRLVRERGARRRRAARALDPARRAVPPAGGARRAAVRAGARRAAVAGARRAAALARRRGARDLALRRRLVREPPGAVQPDGARRRHGRSAARPRPHARRRVALEGRARARERGRRRDTSRRTKRPRSAPRPSA